ncbi:MAG: DNA internalization-related competence protein ComEC/Rec2 [Deltaproteobacteria bacterium]|nr:DNA internalization-related competence protein ComEC/Rec2 [Deltaproteobacteria bacterium]
MRPLVPIAVSFITGLALEAWLGLSVAASVALFVIAFIVFVALAFLSRKNPLSPPIRTPLYPSIALFFSLGLLFASSLVNERTGASIAFIREAAQSRAFVDIEGVIAEKYETRKDGRTRFVIDVRSMGYGQGDMKGAEAKISLSYDGDSGSISRGDIVAFSSRLTLPRNFKTPGGFDYEWWSRRNGIDASAWTRGPGLRKIEDMRSPFAALDSFRTKRAAFIDTLGLENAGIIKALTIGERAGVPSDVERAFRDTGTTHILSISGLHVGLVAAASYFIFLWLLKRSRRLMLEYNVVKLALLLSIFPVLFYGAVSGFSVPSERAVIMAVAALVAAGIGRFRDIYSAAALAALVILVFTPGALWDTSFQLSFAAVIALIVFVPRIMRPSYEKAAESGYTLKSRVVLYAKGMCVVSIVAWIATLPIISAVFHSFTPISVPANLVIVPLAGMLAVPLSLLGVFFSLLYSPLAAVFFHSADILLTLSVRLADFLSSIPYSNMRVTGMSGVEIVLYYCLLAAVVFVTDRRRLAYYFAAIAAVFVFAVVYRHYAYVWPKDFTMTVLDVGQGESILLEFQDRGSGVKTMLIDAGGAYVSSGFDAGERIVAPYLWSRGIKKLDYLVLTHPQQDHMGGMGFIAENFAPSEFWWSGPGRLDTLLENELGKRHVPVSVKNAASEPVYINGTRLEFISPEPGYSGKDVNSASLVFRVNVNDVSFLFTGDIPAKTEAALLKKNIKADVLKIAHHGSRNSSSEVFLNAVAPRFAAISAGYNNAFSFPAEETIESLKKRGIKILRTDIDGAFAVVVDGKAVRAAGLTNAPR